MLYFLNPLYTLCKSYEQIFMIKLDKIIQIYLLYTYTNIYRHFFSKLN